MKETISALDQFLSRTLTIASSSKAWFTFLGMALAAYIGFHQGGMDGMLIALSGALGLPTLYTVTKTVQNVKLANGSNGTAALAAPAATIQPAPDIDVDSETTAAGIPTPVVSPPAPETVLATSSVAQDQPAAAPIEPNTPFDREAFMAKVESGVLPDYGVRNQCTLLYEAEKVLTGWDIDNVPAWKDARAFMYILADKAFKEIWGQGYEDALIDLNDNPPCTYPNLEYKAMQRGMPFYAILLELKKFQS